MPPIDEDHNVSIATLAELGARLHDPVGVRVFVEEDRTVYTSVGRTTDEIAWRIGWTQSSVWIPEHARQDMLEKHGVIRDPIVASSLVLLNPLGVWKRDGQPTCWLFFADSTMLREADLLGSRTTRYVDAIIEARPVKNGTVLRLFHLSPRKKNYGSIQLWP
jgi:hypothetical protein